MTPAVELVQISTGISTLAYIEVMTFVAFIALLVVDPFRWGSRR